MNTDKYAAIAESTYSKSFWSAIVFVVILIVTSAFGYSVQNEVIDFVKDTIWIFVIPVTVRIIGVEAIPQITELVRELRGSRGVAETRRGK